MDFEIEGLVCLFGGIIVVFGKLFIGSENGVVNVLDVETGELLWVLVIEGEVLVVFVVDNNIVIVNISCGVLIVFN